MNGSSAICSLEYNKQDRNFFSADLTRATSEGISNSTKHKINL